jgi:hypothetical protein
MALGALAACGLVERKRTARKAQAQLGQLGQLDPALSHALPIEMGPILWATRFRKDRYGTNDLTNVNIFGVAQSWTWFSLREAAAPHLLPGFPTCEHLDPICNQVLGYWDDIQRIISISLSPTIVTNEWL